MNNISTFITTASWEPRFKLGFCRMLEKMQFETIIMYFLEEYSKFTLENRKEVSQICKEKKLNLIEIQLDIAADSWKTIFHSINEIVRQGRNVIVDITTMPREITWTIFYLLNNIVPEICYVYHKPEGYSQEWLSRDPGKIRLVYKLSGIAQLGLPTVLLVVTGFDVDRVSQLLIVA